MPCVAKSLELTLIERAATVVCAAAIQGSRHHLAVISNPMKGVLRVA